jgi:hypothetical protein
VRVRDTVLWEIAHSNEHDPHRAFEAAAALLRGAPVGVIAPIGTVTALLGWLIGDGVRAMAALDRVWDEDPDYSLAELLGRSINAGLSPISWREMMGGLTREACRGARVLDRRRLRWAELEGVLGFVLCYFFRRSRVPALSLG